MALGAYRPAKHVGKAWYARQIGADNERLCRVPRVVGRVIGEAEDRLASRGNNLADLARPQGIRMWTQTSRSPQCGNGLPQRRSSGLLSPASIIPYFQTSGENVNAGVPAAGRRAADSRRAMRIAGAAMRCGCTSDPGAFPNRALEPRAQKRILLAKGCKLELLGTHRLDKVSRREGAGVEKILEIPAHGLEI